MLRKSSKDGEQDNTESLPVNAIGLELDLR